MGNGRTDSKIHKYQNWKRLSDEYDKMDSSLQVQPNAVPDKYMDMNAVDIDQFNKMLAPE